MVENKWAAPKWAIDLCREIAVQRAKKLCDIGDRLCDRRDTGAPLDNDHEVQFPKPFRGQYRMNEEDWWKWMRQRHR